MGFRIAASSSCALALVISKTRPSVRLRRCPSSHHQRSQELTQRTAIDSTVASCPPTRSRHAPSILRAEPPLHADSYLPRPPTGCAAQFAREGPSRNSHDRKRISHQPASKPSGSTSGKVRKWIFYNTVEVENLLQSSSDLLGQRPNNRLEVLSEFIDLLSLSSCNLPPLFSIQRDRTAVTPHISYANDTNRKFPIDKANRIN